MSSHEQDTHELGREAGSVGGGWLGTYAYTGGQRAQPPVRFEATLTEPDGEGKFRGTILDDHGLGEAKVAGGQSGRGIRFSKRYHRRGQAPVSYEGTLADDGRTMQGTWRTVNETYGVWDARRLWSEAGGEAADEDVESDDVESEAEARDVGRVREVVRLG